MPRGGLPEALEREAHRLEGESDRERQVALARQFVMRRVIYDASKSVGARYAAFFNQTAARSWLDFVLDLGRGDCDVKNAIMVFLLRRLGVPSRLAIGPLGEGGRTLPGMHAWTEYYHLGWRTADATFNPDSTGTSGAAAESAPVSPSGDPRDLPAPDGPAPDGGSVSGKPSGQNSPSPLPFEALGRIALAAAAVGILSLLVGVVALFGGRRRPPIYAPGGDEKQRAVAAEILASAMAHPEMWMKSAGLKKRPLLPVLGGGPGMSLDEAASRGQNGALWMSRGGTALVQQALKKGAVILDAGDEAFRKVIARLPGMSDLDEIARLSPIPPDAVPADLAPVGRLVRRMNRVLGGCGLRGLTFCLTLGQTEPDFTARDVDLTGLGLSAPKYIVVPARSALLQRCAEEVPSAPGLAVFTALNGLMVASAMLRQHRAMLLAEAARDIFEEARWTGR
jgi:hypothetical protein